MTTTASATESGPGASGGSGPSVRSLSLLVPGSFTDGDPYRGLESTLRLFEYGERLGFDGAWIRQQHLVPNVSSAAVFLAAASQRTRRVELGTAVIPIGTAQLTQIRAYREKFAGPGQPRVIAGRVIVPLDGAGAGTRRKYRDYQAGRHQRTLAPIGERRILIAPDLVGGAAEIVAALRADPVLTEVTELQLELPYAFADEEYEQILSDVVTSVAPQLGWSAAPWPG